MPASKEISSEACVNSNSSGTCIFCLVMLIYNKPRTLRNDIVNIYCDTDIEGNTDHV